MNFFAFYLSDKNGLCVPVKAIDNENRHLLRIIVA